MESFNDSKIGEKPVLVYYFETWCNPCKMVAPTVEAVGKEMSDQIRTLKIDIDKNEQVALKYRIQSVPTLIIFKKGEIAWRNSGVIDKNALIQHIKSVL